MPVPKTSMDEDDLATTSENKVRMTRQIRGVQAKAEAKSMGNAPNEELRLRVLRTDC